MTIVFADSSALVKLYVDEPQAGRVRTLERRTPFVASAVARVEVPAALWRKVRIGELDTTDARMLSTAFEVDWYGNPDAGPRYPVIAASAALLADAARLCEIHDLAPYDSVQLASALALTGERPVALAAFDRRLRRAAEAEGLAPVP